MALANVKLQSLKLLIKEEHVVVGSEMVEKRRPRAAQTCKAERLSG